MSEMSGSFLGAGGSSPEAAMAKLVESHVKALERRGSLTELDRNTMAGAGVGGGGGGAWKAMTPKPGKSYAMAAVGAKTPEAEDVAPPKAMASTTGSKLNPALGSRIEEYKRTLSEDVVTDGVVPADGTPGWDPSSPWASVRRRVSTGAGLSGSAQKWESVLAAVRAVDSPRSAAGSFSARVAEGDSSPAGSDESGSASGYDSPAAMTLSGAPSLVPPSNALYAAAQAAATETPPSVLSQGSSAASSPTEGDHLSMTAEKAAPPLMLTPMYVEAASDMFAAMLDDAFALGEHSDAVLHADAEDEGVEAAIFEAAISEVTETAVMALAAVAEEETKAEAVVVTSAPAVEEEVVEEKEEAIATPAAVVVEEEEVVVVETSAPAAAAAAAAEAIPGGWSVYAQERVSALLDAIQPKVGWRWRASRRAAMAAGNLAKVWAGMRQEDRRRAIQVGGAGLLLASAGLLGRGALGVASAGRTAASTSTALAVIVPMSFAPPTPVPSFADTALGSMSSVISDLASLRPNDAVLMAEAAAHLAGEALHIAGEAFGESVAYARHEMSSLMQDPVGFAASLEVRANVQLDQARDLTRAFSDDVSHKFQRLKAAGDFYASLAAKDVSKLHQIAILSSASAWSALDSAIPEAERASAVGMLASSAVAALLLSHVIVRAAVVQLLAHRGSTLGDNEVKAGQEGEDAKVGAEETPRTPIQATPPSAALAQATTGLRRTARRLPPRTPRFV